MQSQDVKVVEDVIHHMVENSTSEAVQFLQDLTANTTISSWAEEIASYNIRPGEYLAMAGFVISFGLFVYLSVRDCLTGKNVKTKKIE